MAQRVRMPRHRCAQAEWWCNMTSLSPLFFDIADQIRRARDLPGILELYQTVLSADPLTAHERSRLALNVFEQMRTATADDRDTVAEVLAGPFFEFCIADFVAESPEDSDIRLNRQRAREMLPQWIEEYPQDSQLRIISTIFGRIVPLLESEHAVAAIRIVALIGYRDDSVMERLFRIGLSDVTRAAYCADALVSCGIRCDDRTRALLRAIVESDRPQDVGYPLSRMPVSATNDIISRYLQRMSEWSEDNVHLHIGLAIVAKLVGHANGVNELRHQVWSLARRFRSIVLMDSRIAASIDAKDVVTDLLSWIGDFPEIADESLRVWRAAIRLEDCTRPVQLASFRAGVTNETANVLSRVAVADTSNGGEFSTMTDKAKEAAWQLLMCCGHGDFVGLLSQGVPNEKNPWIQEKIMKTAACLGVRVLPAFVREWIETPLNCSAKEPRPFAQREGALALARSAGTYEAFAALLNWGFTFEGHVLLSVSEGLSDVAYSLIRSGDVRIVPELITKLGRSHVAHQREIAASALGNVAGTIHLDSNLVSILTMAISDDTLPGYSRAALVSVLHFAECRADDAATLLVAGLADRSDDERLAWESCVFLIRRPFWERYLDIIWRRLGYSSEQEAGSRSDFSAIGWRAWIVGELFLQAPERFGALLERVLRTANDESCFMLARCLSRATRFPTIVVDAVENRIIKDTTLFHSPSYMFTMLGYMDEKRLVSDSLASALAQWSIDSKMAYANALASAQYNSSDLAARRLSLLDALGCDGALEVRRAANRAIAKLDPEALILLWRGRAQSQSLQMRLRAAETVEWLPANIWQDEGDPDVAALCADRFRAVRAGFYDAVKLADERSRVSLCLEKVTAVRSDQAGEIIEAFPFGTALSKLGDSEVIEVLRTHAEKHELPLNVLTWINQIVKRIEKEKRKSKHDVGVGWDTIVEHFEGTVTIGEQSHSGQCHLWRSPQDNPAALGSWGGTIALDAELTLKDIFGADIRRRHVTITGKDRATGQAVVTRTVEWSVLIVTGSGGYPGIIAP
jgi:hypothetical protein